MQALHSVEWSVQYKGNTPGDDKDKEKLKDLNEKLKSATKRVALKPDNTR